jgi:hypothetical protein
MIPSRTSCQIGSTVSRFENRTVATPLPFSMRALPGTTVPRMSPTEKAEWESRSGAPALTRSRRICAGSIDSTSRYRLPDQ